MGRDNIGENDMMPKSICCGEGVRPRFQKVGAWGRLTQEEKDKANDEGIYICLRCKKYTDAYFSFRMEELAG
jgi:hypothetical protein